MLVQTMESTLCQWGLHTWEVQPGQPHVHSCARCGALRVTLRPGGRVQVGPLELKLTVPKVITADREEAR